MELVGYGLVLPYSVLWIFLIWWLIKPIYFPFYDKDKLPSRFSALWITAVIYIAMTVAIILSVDLENTTKGVASNSEMLAFFTSLVIVILVGVWSVKVAKSRKVLEANISSKPLEMAESTIQSPSKVAELEKSNTYNPINNTKVEPISNNSDEDLYEPLPELNDLELEDEGNLKSSFEPEPWRNKHSDADFQIGIYSHNHDLKFYYCEVDDLYKNHKGDWVVGVIDTINHTDKTFNIHKIDELEDKWGARYLLYEDMVRAFADELNMEVDIWGEDDPIEDEPQVAPVTEPPTPKPEIEPRKRVPKEQPSHSMVYVDSKGNLSEREINLRNVEAKDGKLYVKAYCFKRKRLRTFVAKNIVSLYDLTTKQTFTDEDEVYNELLSWVLESE